MEFTLDLALLRRILKAETRAATTDLRDGPLTACQRSHARQDERLAQAGDAATLACQPGCSWCCHFSVDVRAVEAFNIIEYVHQHFDTTEQQTLHDTVARNAAVLRPLDDVQRTQHNLPCPFLAAGRCRIYAARPQTCRNYHATDAAGCQLSFEQPFNEDIAPEFAPLVYQSGQAQVEAFAQVMADAGYDMLAYELNSALHEALADPVGTRQRFDAKLPVFLTTAGNEVPAEFSDLAD